MFDRVLNMLLNWLAGCFNFKTIWILKVTNNFLLEKTKNKKNELAKIVERKYYKAELIQTFSNIRLRSQTLANINEIIQNIYNVDLLYILRGGIGSFFTTSYTCPVFQMTPRNVLYQLWWGISNSYITRGWSIFQKILHWQHLPEKLEEAETHHLHLC